MTEAKKNKAPARMALGRGLSSLVSTPVSTTPRETGEHVAAHSGPVAIGNLVAKVISNENQTSFANSNGIIFVDIEKIDNNPQQPRREFKEPELRELSDSIKSKGVLQPVLLRAHGDGADARLEIIAGERRWRAAKLAGLTKIPAIVRTLDDRETLEISIIENVQRENLTPIEEAQAYQRLASEFSLSQQEIAEKVGKDRASVANYLRLLKLAPEILDMLKREEISMGHAKAILTIKEPSAQLSLARKVVKESLSVRDLEVLVSRVVVLDAGHRLSGKKSDESANALQEGIDKLNAFPEVVDRMRQALGTKVLIKHHRSGRGRIEVEYFSEQELDRIVDQICR